MPHVIVKLWPGKSREHRKSVSPDKIAKDVMDVLATTATPTTLRRGFDGTAGAVLSSAPKTE